MTDSITISELDEGILAARRMLDLAVGAARTVGEDAKAWSRFTIRAWSAAEVDKIAAEWGVSPRWSDDGGHYVAEVRDGLAAVEIVYYAERPVVAA